MIFQVPDGIFFEIPEAIIKYNSWKLEQGVYCLTGWAWEDSGTIVGIFSSLDGKNHFYAEPRLLKPLIIKDKDKIESLKCQKC